MMPSPENEDDGEDEIVRGRKHSAQSDNEDQVNASKENKLVKIQQEQIRQ